MWKTSIAAVLTAALFGTSLLANAQGSAQQVVQWQLQVMRDGQQIDSFDGTTTVGQARTDTHHKVVQHNVGCKDQPGGSIDLARTLTVSPLRADASAVTLSIDAQETFEEDTPQQTDTGCKLPPPVPPTRAGSRSGGASAGPSSSSSSISRSSPRSDMLSSSSSPKSMDIGSLRPPGRAGIEADSGAIPLETPPILGGKPRAPVDCKPARGAAAAGAAALTGFFLTSPPFFLALASASSLARTASIHSAQQRHLPRSSDTSIFTQPRSSDTYHPVFFNLIPRHLDNPSARVPY